MPRGQQIWSCLVSRGLSLEHLRAQRNEGKSGSSHSFVTFSSCALGPQPHPSPQDTSVLSFVTASLYWSIHVCIPS